MDAIDELIAHRMPHGFSNLGLRFHRFHRLNPDILVFLMQELITLQENGWTRTSFGSLWHHARWVLSIKRRAPGETFEMSQNLAAHYSRAVVVLHPELFNGFYAMEEAQADEDFGVRIEPAPRKHRVGYIRKLQWADGTAIARGWRPSVPHVIPVTPIARKPPVRRSVRSVVEVERHGS